MKVLFVATECAPFIKVGGLGDVVGSLPKELEKLGVQTSIVLPYSHEVKAGKYKVKKFGSISLTHNGQRQIISLKEAKLPGTEVKVIFLSHRYFKGPIYESKKTALLSNSNRFVFFSQIVYKMLRQNIITPDILHLHDYMTGALPIMVNRHPDINNVKTIFTIHRLASHGYIGQDFTQKLDLEGDFLLPSILIDKADDGRLDLLVQGILNADIINTVSPTYAKEILTKKYGEGIESIINKRKKDLYGILNGIDAPDYKPETDDHIFKNYNIENALLGKRINKKHLVKHLFGKAPRKDLPLLGVVSRMDVYQKGLDLLYTVIKNRAQSNRLEFRFVLLGVGNEAYEEKFKKLSKLYPNFVSANITFNKTLARQIFASSDFILIPSKFEPCGLTQMIGMQYGSIPIARKTGGLIDSIEDGKTGILFSNYSVSGLDNAIQRGLKLYAEQRKMDSYVKLAMQKDFSWEKSAKDYLDLYQKALQK